MFLTFSESILNHSDPFYEDARSLLRQHFVSIWSVMSRRNIHKAAVAAVWRCLFKDIIYFLLSSLLMCVQGLEWEWLEGLIRSLTWVKNKSITSWNLSPPIEESIIYSDAWMSEQQFTVVAVGSWAYNNFIYVYMLSGSQPTNRRVQRTSSMRLASRRISFKLNSVVEPFISLTMLLLWNINRNVLQKTHRLCGRLWMSLLSSVIQFHHTEVLFC